MNNRFKKVLLSVFGLLLCTILMLCSPYYAQADNHADHVQGDQKSSDSEMSGEKPNISNNRSNKFTVMQEKGEKGDEQNQPGTNKEAVQTDGSTVPGTSEVIHASAEPAASPMTIKPGKSEIHYDSKNKVLVVESDVESYTLVVNTRPKASVSATWGKFTCEFGPSDDGGIAEINLPNLYKYDNKELNINAKDEDPISISLVRLGFVIQSLRTGEAIERDALVEGDLVKVSPLFDTQGMSGLIVEIVDDSNLQNRLCAGRLEPDGFARLVLPCLRSEDRTKNNDYFLRLVQEDGEIVKLNNLEAKQAIFLKPSEKLSLEDVLVDVNAEADAPVAFATTKDIDSGDPLKMCKTEDGVCYYDISEAKNLALIIKNKDIHYLRFEHEPGFADAEDIMEVIKRTSGSTSTLTEGIIEWTGLNEGLDTLTGDHTLVIKNGKEGSDDSIILFLHRDEKKPDPLCVTLAKDQPDVISPDVASVSLSINRDCSVTVDYGDEAAPEEVQLEAKDGGATLPLNSARLKIGQEITITADDTGGEKSADELKLQVHAPHDRLLVFNGADGAEWDGNRYLPQAKIEEIKLEGLLLSGTPVDGLEVWLGDSALEATLSDDGEAIDPDVALNYKNLTAVDAARRVSLVFSARQMADAAKAVEIVDGRFQEINLSFSSNGEPVKLYSEGEARDSLCLAWDASRAKAPTGLIVCICILALIFIASFAVFIATTIKLRKTGR